MGTQVRIVLYAPDDSVAEVASQAAFQRIAELDSLLSDYQETSEVSVLARAAVTGEAADVEVGPDLMTVSQEALRWMDATDGAFDVTMGPVTRLWRWAMRRGELPPREQVDSVLGLSGPGILIVDTQADRMRLTRPGARLDLGGIAKGYVADEALEELGRFGVARALVDAGGDLALGEAPPGQSGWRIEFPNGVVYPMANAGVATSGDRYQFLESGGVRYSHIVDPRTGLGVPNAPTVAVVAEDGMTADVLASALTVMSESDARALLSGLEGVHVRVVPRDGSEGWETPGFPGDIRNPEEMP